MMTHTVACFVFGLSHRHVYTNMSTDFSMNRSKLVLGDKRTIIVHTASLTHAQSIFSCLLYLLILIRSIVFYWAITDKSRLAKIGKHSNMKMSVGSHKKKISIIFLNLIQQPKRKLQQQWKLAIKMKVKWWWEWLLVFSLNCFQLNSNI